MEHEFGTIRVSAEFTENPAQKIESKRDVVNRYGPLGDDLKECLYAVFLNGSNQLLGDKVIGLGSRDTVEIDIQDLIRTAAVVNAAAVILVHNHPSRKATATEQDLETTEQTYEVLEKINVDLLDHVIVTGNGSYSMRQKSDGPF